MKLVGVAALLTLAVLSPASAEEPPPSGGKLIEWCNSEGERRAQCIFYVAGVNHARSFIAEISPASAPRTCVDPDSTIGESIAEFKRWALSHKDELERNAAGLVIAAEIDLHPCQEVQNTPKILR